MSEAKKTDGKRTRVNVIHDVTAEMCRALPNVEVPEAYSEALGHAVMREILFNAALANRDWEFKVTDCDGEFDIRVGTENLARVSYTYSRRAKADIPHLSAHRLDTNRRGARVYSHKDPAAILRKIREVVYPKTDAENFSGYAIAIQNGLRTRTYEIAGELSKARDKLQQAALAFVLSPQYKEEFVRFGHTQGDGVKEVLDAFAQHEADKEVIQKMAKGGAAYAKVAIVHDGWYVEHDKVLTKYAEYELPEKYSNAHALKMVNAEVLLPDVGYKVSDSMFLIFVQEE